MLTITARIGVGRDDEVLQAWEGTEVPRVGDCLRIEGSRYRVAEVEWIPPLLGPHGQGVVKLLCTRVSPPPLPK